MSFLEKNGFDYQTETEKKLSEAMKRAEDDQLQEDIRGAYNDLLEAVNDAKRKDLVDKKAEIKSLLSDEILKRYFYREGLYDYQVKHNPEILEAVEVLNDVRRYQKILQ